MIALLRGQVIDKHPDRLVVDVQGVGYAVHVPLSTYYNLGEEGADVTLRALPFPAPSSAVGRGVELRAGPHQPR